MGFMPMPSLTNCSRSPTTSIPHPVRGDSKGAEEPVGFTQHLCSKELKHQFRLAEVAHQRKRVKCK
jgi:hypothetical protein